MKVQDAFRAQYFLASLEKEIAQVEGNFCSCDLFARPLKSILSEFVTSLCIELDQLLLPTLVFEIHKAKQEKLLKGSHATARYESFFISGNRYTERAYAVLEKYPFLFEAVDVFIFQTLKSFSQCLHCFTYDQKALRKWLVMPQNVLIDAIHPLNGSDRHRGKQSFLMSFSDGTRIIYKPVDLAPDLLFAHYVQTLDLEEPYDLRSLEVLPREGYGWIKFIEPKECKHLYEIENFYKRTGVLLAVADALNYTDGHCENLIACGSFPILLDGETLFQNYAPKILDQKNILSTLFLQKSAKDENFFFASALQAPHGIKLEYLQTHAIHDHTDEIEIRYFGINPSEHHHCPKFNGEPCKAYDYVSFIIEGYCKGYERITKYSEKIFNNERWWKSVGEVTTRTVLRETAAYLYLLRKIQQPDLIASHEAATAFLLENLGLKAFVDYEIEDLLSMNIPYFYHIPSKRHLYDGQGKEYSNVFDLPAIEGLRNQLSNRTEKKMLFDCEILTRHLIPISLEHAHPMTVS